MEEKKIGPKLSKETVNIIRTTQRNNIELTHIADNKANVLLSLNAIMITFLIPLILSNVNIILEKFIVCALNHSCDNLFRHYIYISYRLKAF